VLEATLRLERLVEGFILLARADRPLEGIGVVDMRAVVVATLDALAAAGHSDESQVRFDPPPDPVSVVGHRDLLTSLVTGLVENARRYGASAAGVEIVLESTGSHADLSVLDRGPGFPPDLLNRLFERFARGDVSRSRATGGSGLGLAIAKAIVDAHRGEITAGPRDGGGARVRVRLPLAKS
jgi:two-component system OmpR family sensor kinase